MNDKFNINIFNDQYTLVICAIAMDNGTSTVDLPIKKIVIFSSFFLNVYQRVCGVMTNIVRPVRPGIFID